MHLVELLSFRSVPAGGISMGLTRRCPLSCTHCSTNSTLLSEQAPADMFVRFVDSFTRENRPEVLSMSGGEAMLRPRLVRTLAEKARAVSTRSIVLSGMFFARSGPVPAAILEAIQAVDHFSVSLDAFHEREVPRKNVFRVLDHLLAMDTDLSIHLVGQDADDPYIDDTVADVQKTFGDRVPMLINTIASFGRAKAWFTPQVRSLPAGADATPCMMASWPVIGFDGSIAACANDDVLDNIPPHLRLGHAAVDTWPVIKERTLRSPMMRAIRLFGPEYLAHRFDERGPGCGGFCQTCMGLSPDPALENAVGKVMEKPSTAILEQQVSAIQQRAGAIAFAGRYGLPRYAELVALGATT